MLSMLTVTNETGTSKLEWGSKLAFEPNPLIFWKGKLRPQEGPWSAQGHATSMTHLPMIKGVTVA